MKNDPDYKMEIESKKTSDKLFFAVSGAIVISLTITLLLCYSSYMGTQINNTISNVSRIHMSEINLQLQQKFRSIMELRLMQVDEILAEITPDTYGDSDAASDTIKEMGMRRNFTLAGFLDEDYELCPVYGGNYTIEGDNDIEASIEYDGNVLEYATDENGKKYLMIGRGTTDYVLENGKRSVAFVVCIEMNVMDEVLFLDSESGNVYTHVINHNGDFIISNGLIEGDNYFDGVIKTEINDVKEAESCINELKYAIEEGTQYSFSYVLNGERFYVCCSPFSDNSEWYYVTVMRSDIFDGYFDTLNRVRFVALVVVLLILLSTILAIILIYYRLNQKRIKELADAKALAIKANNAKTEFLSSMSHDMRTPMNAVIGMTNIAIQHIEDKERVQYCLEQVVISAKHLLSLVNDVLDISKIESGKMQLSIRDASLKSVIDDIVALSQAMLKEKGQKFDVFIRDIIAEEVYCDDIRLYQILMNLVSNAFKYTPEGGTILVEVYQEASSKGENYVKTHFKVVDNGIGMSPEFAERVFDKFERENNDTVRKTTGSGLGMAISKQLADLMEGELEVESVLNEGSVFQLSVEFKIAGKFEMTEKLPAWDVLVVDDDVLLCETAASNLEELGVKAEWVTESTKAVELIEKRREEGKEFDFVLLDWNMPDMDGVETIRKIRTTGSVSLPVFLISAYDLSNVEEKIDLTEFEGFIAKPLFKSRLYQALGKYAGHVSTESVASKKPVMSFANKRILVAEDVEINWVIVREALISVGIQAEKAENGRDCIEMFRSSPVGYYDLILMDIRMPVMNGIDATKEIRKLDRKDKNLPIIAMTANAFSEDVQQCLDNGMNGHVAKPIDLKTFFAILHRFLDN